MATTLRNQQSINDFISYVDRLKKQRQQNMESILVAMRNAERALEHSTSYIADLIIEFNKQTNTTSTALFKAQWGWRPLAGGPLGPDGPTFFEYYQLDSQAKVRRRKYFRARDLSRVFGTKHVESKQSLVQLIKQKGKQRSEFVRGINNCIQQLYVALNIHLPVKDEATQSSDQPGRVKTRIQMMLSATPKIFNELEFNIRRLLQRIEEIDIELEELMSVANSLGRTRSGSIRLSWHYLKDKHVENRVTGPPGPYWFTLYIDPLQNRKMYRIKKLTRVVIRKTYSGKHTKQLLSIDKQLIELKRERQSINEVIVLFTRMTKAKRFNQYIEENTI